MPDLYEEYENLIIEKDAKLKEAGSIHTAYIKEFGELITKVFEKKIECIKKKKSIAFCQAYVNRGEPINVNELEKFIKKEMKEYNKQLKVMISDLKTAKKAEIATEAAYTKSKITYRKIAKLIHPDTHSEAFENEEIKELWNRVKEAYAMNDDEALEELEVLIHKKLDEIGIGHRKPVIENLDEKINVLKDEIHQIINTDPYQLRHLLDDKEAMAAKRQALNQELKEYMEYEKQLDEILGSLMMNNGSVMIWQTN